MNNSNFQKKITMSFLSSDLLFFPLLWPCILENHILCIYHNLDFSPHDSNDPRRNGTPNSIDTIFHLAWPCTDDGGNNYFVRVRD